MERSCKHLTFLGACCCPGEPSLRMTDPNLKGTGSIRCDAQRSVDLQQACSGYEPKNASDVLPSQEPTRYQ